MNKVQNVYASLKQTRIPLKYYYCKYRIRSHCINFWMALNVRNRICIQLFIARRKRFICLILLLATNILFNRFFQSIHILPFSFSLVCDSFYFHLLYIVLCRGLRAKYLANIQIFPRTFLLLLLFATPFNFPFHFPFVLLSSFYPFPVYFSVCAETEYVSSIWIVCNCRCNHFSISARSSH